VGYLHWGDTRPVAYVDAVLTWPGKPCWSLELIQALEKKQHVIWLAGVNMLTHYIVNFYGGWFGTLLFVVLSLATARQSAKRRVVRLSSYDGRQTACCRDVTLLHGSNRRIGYLYIYQPSDRATTRQHPARQRAVWRVLLATGRRRQCNNAPFGAFC
jgi:hypothetical protein